MLPEQIRAVLAKIDEEIEEKRDVWPGLRVVYLRYLRDNLENVLQGSEDLENVLTETRRDMERQIQMYATEYYPWIESLLDYKEEDEE